MLVRMKTHFSGTRNMQEWPDVGGTIELPDVEAERMIAAGHCEEAIDDGTAEAERDETAAPNGDGGATEADGDTQTVGDGDAGQAAGASDGGVSEEATKPTARRARKSTRRAPAKKRTRK